jgi:FkbM family methyltransferase
MKISAKVRLLNFFRQVWMIPVLESFLASKTQGLPPNHFICKWVPNPYQYRSGSLRRIRQGGVQLEVDISDYIGHYLYFAFEDSSANALFRQVTAVSHVVDVGANLGWTALRMASLAPQGWVMAFEPDRENFTRCQANVSLNSFPNLFLFQVGLGSQPGTATMEVRTPSNRGGNRISPSSEPTNKTIEMARLDDMLSQFPDNRIDLIKIDVEGFELHVLRGAEQTLKQCKPVLFIELDDNNLRDQGDSARELVQFLEGHGYQTLEDAATGTKISSSTSFDHCHMDILAK